MKPGSSITQKILALLACLGLTTVGAQAKTNFGKDKEFLQKYTKAVVLTDKSGKMQVVIVPEYQGRVMTSTANGDDGISFGWLNYELIASKKLEQHMNPYGGEDRFWMGPEGGQFGLYFPPGSKFDVDNWQVPAPFDTDTYPIINKTKTSVTFGATFKVENYHGTSFDVKVNRKVNLVNTKDAAKILDVKIPDGVKMVGYGTVNTVTNIGKKAWNKKTGLVSIWILGNYAPSKTAKIVLPINKGSVSKLGEKVEVYSSFGPIPSDRMTEKDNAIIYTADGNLRGKIGLTPARAKDILGSYDSSQNTLTIVKYNKPAEETDYVNSLWEIQKYPYKGDVVNAYNDGPLGKGLKQLGPFYELETSSPALALKPNESFTHTRYTFHFVGTKDELNTLAQKLLGVSLAEITEGSSAKHRNN